MDSLGGNLVRALYGYSSKQVELSDLDKTDQSHFLKDAGTGSFSIFSSKRRKKDEVNFFGQLLRPVLWRAQFVMSSFREVQHL